MKNRLNLLSISLYGAGMAAGPGSVQSGALKRQIDYAGFLEKYFIIVPSPQKRPGEQKIGANLFVLPVFSRWGKFSFFFKALSRAKEIIESENIDCIVCDNPHYTALIGILLKRKYKLPLVAHSLGDIIDNPRFVKLKAMNRVTNFMSRVNLPFIDILRVTTVQGRERLIEKGIPGDRVLHAPVYIDFPPFEDFEADPGFREDLLGKNFHQVVLFLGRFSREKDLPTLLRAVPGVVARYPGVLFLLVGSGPDMPRVRKLITRLGIERHVKLAGRVTDDQVKQCLKAADIFCITSVFEGTCLVLHEAAICKLPVVTTDFTGALDLVEQGTNGFYVNTGDSEALAGRLLRLLKNPGERKELGENNYRIIKEKFDKESALEKLRDLFQHAVKGSKAR